MLFYLLSPSPGVHAAFRVPAPASGPPPFVGGFLFLISYFLLFLISFSFSFYYFLFSCVFEYNLTNYDFSNKPGIASKQMNFAPLARHRLTKLEFLSKLY